MIIEDDDDWTDLEKEAKPGSVLPDAQVRLSRYTPGKTGKAGKARASIAFRRDLVAWLEEKGPRFKLQIGGANANKVRLIPDASGGRFEFVTLKGTARMTLGHVTAWPDEVRDPVEAKASFDGLGNLVLSLPETFAKPTPKALAPSELPRPPIAARAQSPQPFPITTAAPGLAKQAPARSANAVNLGEPPAGRSALDQRRATTPEPEKPKGKGVTLSGTRWGK